MSCPGCTSPPYQVVSVPGPAVVGLSRGSANPARHRIEDRMAICGTCVHRNGNVCTPSAQSCVNLCIPAVSLCPEHLHV